MGTEGGVNLQAKIDAAYLENLKNAVCYLSALFRFPFRFLESRSGAESHEAGNPAYKRLPASMN